MSEKDQTRGTVGDTEEQIRKLEREKDELERRPERKRLEERLKLLEDDVFGLEAGGSSRSQTDNRTSGDLNTALEDAQARLRTMQQSALNASMGGLSSRGDEYREDVRSSDDADDLDDVMTASHKQALRMNRDVLVHNMTPDDIFNDLISKHILTNADVSRIKEKNTIEAMNEKLLNVLIRRSDKAFYVFVASLRRTLQGGLANRLDPRPQSLNSKRKWKTDCEQIVPARNKRFICTCEEVEEQILQMAKGAFCHIRRHDASPAAFEQFKKELQQTNQVIKESMEISNTLKELCRHGDLIDLSFGGGGQGGRDRDRDRSFNKRGGGGGGGRGGFKRPGGDRGGPPQDGVKKFRDEMDDNWMEDDRHPLMQVSFMETKPEDLGEEWFFVVCPHGKRRILVAANEITQSYNNGGIPGSKFKSCLPSGSPLLKEVHKADDLTIFDAIFCGEEKKFYIIDLLHWKHYPYYETEADFRFFCLTEKFSHLDKPSEITSDNEYGLELLPKVSWTESGFKEALEKAKDDSLKVEGVLFIHKTALYDTQSDTPGCQWLRLDKMESIFGFAPPEGLDFVISNSKDDKKKKEQEEMKKVKEQRDAAIEEAKRDHEKSEDGVKEEGRDYEIEGENYGEGKDEEEAHGDEGEGHNAGGEEGDYGGEGYGDQSGGYNDYTADTDEGVWKG